MITVSGVGLWCKWSKNKQSLCTTDQHSLEGSRVVNLEKLQQFADDLTQHSTSCEGLITLNQENRAGSASTINNPKSRE